MHTEKVQADDAVRVDVWMHRYWAVRTGEEGHFWGFWVGMLASGGVGGAERGSNSKRIPQEGKYIYGERSDVPMGYEELNLNISRYVWFR